MENPLKENFVSMMPAFLPSIAFACIFMVAVIQQPSVDYRRVFLRSAVAWAVFLVIATELLSLIRGITIIGLVLFWLLLIAACLVWVAHRYFSHKSKLISPRLHFPTSISQLVLCGVIILICAITAVIAWVAPPNTVDSLSYHMPKVVHWAQDKAVHMFASGMYSQNSMPPGAEMIVLHSYVLARGDWLVNFVEWFAMLGSVIGVSLLAAQLGAKPTGQVFAAVFAATLPMGIAQASSTMVDYVVSFWVVCVAAEVMAAVRGQFDWRILTFASLAAGLAVLTKQTAAVYLLPLGILLSIHMFRRLGIRCTLAWGGAGILLAGTLIAGHAVRMIVTYNNPISDLEHLNVQTNDLKTLQGITSNLLRNVALHTGTPWTIVSDSVWVAVNRLHSLIGLDVNDPRTTSIGPYRVIGLNRGENQTGNPVHASMILFGFPIVIFLRRRLGNNVAIFTLIVASSFILLSVLLKWQIFGSRFQLPFFVLSAPVIAVLIDKLMPSWSLALVGLVLLALSWLWLVNLPERPLFPSPEDLQYPSILKQSRKDLYYSPSIRMLNGFVDEVLASVKETGCSKVGISISGNSLEYLYWVSMDAPRDDLQIEWIVSGPTRRYRKADFKPCAVICEYCPQEWLSIIGLPIFRQWGPDFKLFMNASAP